MQSDIDCKTEIIAGNLTSLMYNFFFSPIFWKFFTMVICGLKVFECANGDVIDERDHCDGQPDCGDTSDETNCRECSNS